MKVNHKDSISRIIWKTPLFRAVLIVAVLGSITLAAYDLLTVYPAFQNLIISSIEKKAIQSAQHLLTSVRTVDGKNEFTRNSLSQLEWQELAETAKSFGMWKLRVFSSKGEILFSTTSQEIGQINEYDYFSSIVAQGNIFSKLDKKQGTSMEGEVIPQAIFELYVPKMQNLNFQGAIEVYYDITEEVSLMDSLTKKSGLIYSGLIFFIVIVTITLLIRIASESKKLSITQNNLFIQQKIFHDIIDISPNGIMVTDDKLRIQIVNPAFSKITGYQEDEIIGQTPAILSSEKHNDNFYQLMWDSINRKKFWRGEIWNKRKDGTIYPELLNISIIEDDENNIGSYVGTFIDITEQKETEKHLQKLASHDVLTNLPNRLLLMDRLQQAMREALRCKEQIVVMFMDLDGFKQINDQYGHDAGDTILQEVASRLTQIIRLEDTVARIGGDEFVLILRNMKDPVALERIADQIIFSINQPIQFNQLSLHVGISIGVSSYPEDGKDAETLINKADAAMYQSKNTGKNRMTIR